MEREHEQIQGIESRFVAYNRSQERTLDLSDLGLTHVPKRIRSLTDLTILKLSSNSIKYLPAWIDELVELKCLFLDHNPLTQLPSSIGRLQGLTELVLAGC